jgi:glycosyltransferase involved in cell wall biosynthesis
MMQRVFVPSPLSSGMMDRLVQSEGKSFEQITLSSLKNAGISKTIKLLRTVSQMRVVLEDAESEKILNIFLLLFLFSRSKQIQFVRSDLSTFSLKKKDALASFLQTGWATLQGIYSGFKLYFQTLNVKYEGKKVKEDAKNEILYLKTNFWFGVKAGGSVAHVEGVISGFKNKGYTIDYAGLDCSPSLSKSIRRHIKSVVPNYMSFLFYLNLYIFDCINYKIFKNLPIKNYKFIYHRMALNSLSAILLSKRSGIPLVLEYNGSEVWVQRNWSKRLLLEFISQAIENACIRYADYIITISEVLKDELVGRGIPEEKIVCYPNCVDPVKHNPDLFTSKELLSERQRLGFSKDDIILTFMGTFGKWHGVEVLAQAIRYLYELDPAWLKDNKVKFLLVGDGACMPEVKKILSSIPSYSDFVKLIGLVPQEEGPLYLALSDILLSPHSPPNTGESFFGSPTKLFEYMAMKKVIIASDLGQISDVLSPAVHINQIQKVKKNHSAILCEPGSIEQLGQAILHSIEHLSQLSFMKKNAYDKVMRDYTWDKHVEKILDSVLKEKK